AITAVQHVPEKDAIVDNGAHFDGDQSGTVNGVTPPAVQHLTEMCIRDRSQASGTFEQNNHVVINNDGTNGLPGPQMMKAVYDMARKGARDEIQAQMRDGGLFSGGGR
ncbi:tail tape measure protein H, partial [Escherichia coli]|uniref:hypothetical protein n=1 Tax=Escherichia coli TaxID=562 RepID=UPI000B6E689D